MYRILFLDMASNWKMLSESTFDSMSRAKDAALLMLEVVKKLKPSDNRDDIIFYIVTEE